MRGREAERLPCFEPHPFFRLRFERRPCRLRHEGSAGDAENAEHCSEQKTAEHSAEAETCKDKAGFAGKSCADARRQTKGGELGESRPHERRLAGPPFRGSVLNVARCCALPPVSCPESRDAMRRRPCGRQNVFLEALRVVKTTSREAFAGKCASFSRLRRAEPLSCANGRAPGRSAGRSERAGNGAQRVVQRRAETCAIRS